MRQAPSGALDWSGGALTGAGQTTFTGSHHVNGQVSLQFHTLNLQCDTLVTSGGCRMQEGLRSLVQMQHVAAVAHRAREAGIPHVAVVRGPTTGGLFTPATTITNDCSPRPPRVS